MTIDNIHAYAMFMASCFILLLLLNARSHIMKCIAYVQHLVLRYLVYPQLIQRNRYTGRINRSEILVPVLLFAANTFCLWFQSPSIHVAGARAANLSLVNLIPAFAGPHLSFLADFFGISLFTFRRIHRLAGILSFPLLAFHVAIMMTTQTPFPLEIAHNMWGLVGAASLSLLLLFSCPIFRRYSYEVFLRIHQALAALIAFSVWRHLELQPFLTRLNLYILAASFLSMLFLQSMHLLYRNKAMGTGLSQAYIIRDGDAVKIRLRLSRRVRVKAGQYVGLWIPAVSLMSFLQSHPFVVTSWSEGKQQYLHLLIEPCHGLTQKLLKSYLAFFSGPHGLSVPVSNYETVLMIASGFGIASQLPYLRKLIYDYNACKSRNRRIRLIWQLETDDEIAILEPLLNASLKSDTLDEGYILTISIYIASGKKYKIPVGRRVDVYYGLAPDLKVIFEEERAGKYIKRVQVETKEQENMAVLVSATFSIRGRARDLMRSYVGEKVVLFELEYQPT
ncbi:putative cell surface metalloreductase [Corynespora cassiicola Philippines]|uniref:Putative cell surface metalloreductase n=1 Tax=Corynespora cassiicola Philippines TaxID=1448308 RepID=A0A2T2N199_CORCC|nr:putative cell surface metalloreductase [Corynespora cassiicola Philippines]